MYYDEEAEKLESEAKKNPKKFGVGNIIKIIFVILIIVGIIGYNVVNVAIQKICRPSDMPSKIVVYHDDGEKETIKLKYDFDHQLVKVSQRYAILAQNGVILYERMTADHVIDTKGYEVNYAGNRPISCTNKSDNVLLRTRYEYNAYDDVEYCYFEKTNGDKAVSYTTYEYQYTYNEDNNPKSVEGYAEGTRFKGRIFLLYMISNMTLRDV